MSRPPIHCSRREVLKLIAVAGASTAWPGRLFGQAMRPPDASVESITAYLESLRRSEHGYGWGDQEMSHLTPTFGVIGAYHVLKLTPPNREALASYVRSHHPRALKRLQQEARVFDWQQVQALTWLGADTADFIDTVSAFT